MHFGLWEWERGLPVYQAARSAGKCHGYEHSNATQCVLWANRKRWREEFCDRKYNTVFQV